MTYLERLCHESDDAFKLVARCKGLDLNEPRKPGSLPAKAAGETLVQADHVTFLCDEM